MVRQTLRQALAFTAFGGGIAVSAWATDGEPDRPTLEYEHQRAVGHATMPSTMYASNPTETPSPHTTVSGHGNFWERLVGHPSRRWLLRTDGETATELFRNHISPVVQEKCIACHVDGGASGHTQLVFYRSSQADHEALNLGEFEDFLDRVTDGADLILEKISGGSGHGGGVQVAADSADYAHFERFLALLEDEQTPVLTAQTLFDTVRMSPARNTLRRAALIFAGRVPTPKEYESIAETGLRAAIRNVMEGIPFHDFLIRGSNDRLLTDNVMGRVLTLRGTFVEYTNGRIRRCELGNPVSGRFGLGWMDRVEQGARRAPLELIAHVVRNDLPYTEILTADYIMANPWSAEAYGADTEFDDPLDVYEFKPSKFAAYYLDNGTTSYDATATCGNYISYPGDLRLDYPHAGILNTTAFLRRFPTTPTNRNRARARWTYYHFLGVDVEQLAVRTTDPDALADTDNPTMKNPACTGCHGVLDPMAGAFQNYDETGHYRSNYGGRDSLDFYYKNNPPGADEAIVEAGSWELRETVTIHKHLDSGENAVGLAAVENPYRREMGVAGLTVRDDAGRIVARPRLPYGDNDGCVRVAGDYFRMLSYCGITLGVDIAQRGEHSFSIDIWRPYSNFPAAIKMWAGKEFYRHGDTWYRDMREPGFENATSPSADDSVQWLAARIAADPRFAEATVKFWWPAIMGTEVAVPPHATGEADYEGRLLAAQAQHAEVARLGELFREGTGTGTPYNLKDLLVEIVMSPWFRADTVFDDDPVRAVALRDAGARRLLTPEELAAKTLSLTGVQWGRQEPDYRRRHNHALTTDYGVLYGGIGAEGTTRARDLTPVMASVSKLHAVRMSCPVVLREFYLLPSEQRRLFGGIDHTVAPTDSTGEMQIKEKLVELFDSLLGVDATVTSPEIVAAYDFFVDAWKRPRASNRFLDGNLCEWGTDAYYHDDLPEGALAGKDLSDRRRIARTWVVMLAALLMDYRYIHL
ncbi:MAG: DUF1588 domain-containing protein [Pseudomonadales bacterium]|nr:DUF1588 domain-containing protein [Pseudomonadales bacterium]